MSNSILANMTEQKHRVLVYLTAEIMGVIPNTNENDGHPRHVQREHFTFEGETLDDAKTKLNHFLSLAKHFL